MKSTNFQCVKLFFGYEFLRFEAHLVGEHVCFDCQIHETRGPHWDLAKVKIGRIFGGGQPVWGPMFRAQKTVVSHCPPGKVPWNPEKTEGFSTKIRISASKSPGPVGRHADTIGTWCTLGRGSRGGKCPVKIPTDSKLNPGFTLEWSWWSRKWSNWKETNNYLILEIHPLPTVIVWEEHL